MRSIESAFVDRDIRGLKIQSTTTVIPESLGGSAVPVVLYVEDVECLASGRRAAAPRIGIPVAYSVSTVP